MLTMNFKQEFSSIRNLPFGQRLKGETFIYCGRSRALITRFRVLINETTRPKSK